MQDVVRSVDGRLVNRSMVFVQKQYAFIQEGHTEAEAFKLTEAALAEEEGKALKQLEEVTAQARATGAVPALSAMERQKDGRWDRLQFWRKELSSSPYETWSHGKQASLDRWLTKDMLEWEPHQTRYLGQQRFQDSLKAARETIFADVVKPLREKLRTVESAEGTDLTPEDLYSFQLEQAMGEYQEWEEKMLARRAGTWASEEIAALQEWLERNHALVMPGVQDPRPQVAGGFADQARRQARGQVLQYMAFPLLRPEFQSIPYLSRYLARAFAEVAKQEAGRGLRPILISGPLGRREADFAAGEAMLNDALPKLVVKTFVTVAVERPFAWELMRCLLTERIRTAASAAALETLPELRGLGGREAMAQHVEGLIQHLTEVLMTLAADEDTSGLGQDIEVAYGAVNELHRVAQELLHAGEAGAEGGAEAGHAYDAAIDAYKQELHGWVAEDLAIGEALRKFDPKVEAMFGVGVPEAHKAQEAAMERKQSQVLEEAGRDFAFRKREAGRWAWEKSVGLGEVDEYDTRWLRRPQKGREAAKRGEEAGEAEDEYVNQQDMEDWRVELEASGLLEAREQEGAGETKPEERQGPPERAQTGRRGGPRDAKRSEGGIGGWGPRDGGERGRGREAKEGLEGRGARGGRPGRRKSSGGRGEEGSASARGRGTEGGGLNDGTGQVMQPKKGEGGGKENVRRSHGRRGGENPEDGGGKAGEKKE